jgi:hypothetical protein
MNNIIILLQLVLALLSNPQTANSPTTISIINQVIPLAEQAIADQNMTSTPDIGVGTVDSSGTTVIDPQGNITQTNPISVTPLQGSETLTSQNSVNSDFAQDFANNITVGSHENDDGSYQMSFTSNPPEIPPTRFLPIHFITLDHGLLTINQQYSITLNNLSCDPYVEGQQVLSGLPNPFEFVSSTQYTCTMSFTDKQGNMASDTVSFVPNQLTSF